MREINRRLASKSTGLQGPEVLPRTIRPHGISLASIVFAALVVATVGAFFVTTRLKRSAPVIESLTFNRHFSPNGDGHDDTVTFAVRLRRTDDVTVSIVTRDGSDVRTLAEDLRVVRGRRYRFRWDGRTNAGRIAADGEYHVRVSLRRQGRVVTSGRKVFLDTVPPNPVVGSARPAVITPGVNARVRIRYSGPKRRPVLMVYRTDLPKPRLVSRTTGVSGAGVLHWDGRVGLGQTRTAAPAGTYLLVVRVRDAAGNLGPAVVPPRRGSVRGHPGVTVRYLAALAPDRALRAGRVTSFQVFAAGRSYRWRVHRLGESRTLSRGSSRSGVLHVRAPRGQSGVAVLELRVGSHRYEVPFPVQARHHGRVLVVLPALTWQARNPVAQDGDGYPDVLPTTSSVSLSRPYAAVGRPPGFATTAAVIGQLRGLRPGYDVTTDLTIARAGEGALNRYTGVLIAGAPQFAPILFARSLAAYLKGGGRVAWLGTRGFSRAVAVSGDTMTRGRPNTFLGERVRIQPGPRALVVLGDRIGFFGGGAGAFGPFPRLEPTLRLPAGARVLASAGAEPGRPAVVVYRLGRGVVARVGVDGLEQEPAGVGGAGPAARIMPRLWALLSR